MHSSRIRSGRLAATTAVAASALLAVPAGASADELLVGVTKHNRLVTFTGQSPGFLRSTAPITGLQPNEALIGLDSRPANGQLIAISNQSRIYALNPFSASVRALGNPFTPAFSGTWGGMDFNPVVDRIRLVSDSGQNLRINPEDGTVQSDGALRHATGDAGAGSAPAIAAAAYTNSVPGATSTQLFAIDATRDALVLVDPPNDGTLKTVGALGVNTDNPAGFDIAADGTAYAALRVQGQVRNSLFRINLTTGAATAASESNRINAETALVGIAAVGSVPDDKTGPAVVHSVTPQTRSATRGSLPVRVSCNEACTFTARLKVDGQTVATAASQLSAAGQRGVRLTADTAGKRLLQGSMRRRITVELDAKDMTGNPTLKSLSYSV